MTLGLGSEGRDAALLESLKFKKWDSIFHFIRVNGGQFLLKKLQLFMDARALSGSLVLPGIYHRETALLSKVPDCRFSTLPSDAVGPGRRPARTATAPARRFGSNDQAFHPSCAGTSKITSARRIPPAGHPDQPLSVLRAARSTASRHMTARNGKQAHASICGSIRITDARV